MTVTNLMLEVQIVLERQANTGEIANISVEKEKRYGLVYANFYLHVPL